MSTSEFVKFNLTPTEVMTVARWPRLASSILTGMRGKEVQILDPKAFNTALLARFEILISAMRTKTSDQ